MPCRVVIGNDAQYTGHAEICSNVVCIPSEGSRSRGSLTPAAPAFNSQQPPCIRCRSVARAEADLARRASEADQGRLTPPKVTCCVVAFLPKRQYVGVSAVRSADARHAQLSGAARGPLEMCAKRGEEARGVVWFDCSVRRGDVKVRQGRAVVGVKCEGGKVPCRIELWRRLYHEDVLARTCCKRTHELWSYGKVYCICCHFLRAPAHTTPQR